MSSPIVVTMLLWKAQKHLISSGQLWIQMDAGEQRRAWKGRWRRAYMSDDEPLNDARNELPLCVIGPALRLLPLKKPITRLQARQHLGYIESCCVTRVYARVRVLTRKHRRCTKRVTFLLPMPCYAWCKILFSSIIHENCEAIKQSAIQGEVNLPHSRAGFQIFCFWRSLLLLFLGQINGKVKRILNNSRGYDFKTFLYIIDLKILFSLEKFTFTRKMYFTRSTFPNWKMNVNSNSMKNVCV